MELINKANEEIDTITAEELAKEMNQDDVVIVSISSFALLINSIKFFIIILTPIYNYIKLT